MRMHAQQQQRQSSRKPLRLSSTSDSCRKIATDHLASRQPQRALGNSHHLRQPAPAISTRSPRNQHIDAAANHSNVARRSTAHGKDAAQGEFEQPNQLTGHGLLSPPTSPDEAPPDQNTRRAHHPLPFLEVIQRSFGHHYIGDAEAHTDTNAAKNAWNEGALAYAQGSDIFFMQTPTLHETAHEAAHVIQQRNGSVSDTSARTSESSYEQHAEAVAQQVVSGGSSESLLDSLPGSVSDSAGPGNHAPSSAVQRRRIPPNIQALLTAVSGGNGANFAAHAEGALQLINQAMSELTPAQRRSVLRRRRGTMSEAEFAALPRRTRRIRHAEAIIALFPDLELGDPALLDTGPRPSTSDNTNIGTLVTNANTIFASIAGSTRDAWLGDVFGTSNIATAKTHYANARTQMNALRASNDIVTDRSGFSDEVFEGGLSGPDQINVESDAIDNPNDDDSVVTIIHESMHAGNTGIDDDVYMGAAGFQTQSEAAKLANAAHYEVVPRRILDPAHADGYPVTPATSPPTFQTFVPAGTGGSAARTVPEQAAVDAYDRLQNAWALGLNLHRRYVEIFRTPTIWTVPQPSLGGIRFDNSIPFWSKVQKLTVHEKTTITPSSGDAALHPVSQIDVALSEGVTRRLNFGMDVVGALETEAQVLAFEAAHSSSAERSRAFPGGAHTNTDTERDFLIRLTIRQSNVGPITGRESRDFRVVQQLGDPALSAWRDILMPRSPSSFPD